MLCQLPKQYFSEGFTLRVHVIEVVHFQGMNWTGKRVLVTGAGGFIGSHLTERLIELGADVTAFVRYNSRNSRGFLLAPDVRVVEGDLPDAFFWTKADVIFHLAAMISVPYSFHHPEESFRVNAGGTLRILAAAQDMGCERVIVTSSSEVFGSAQYTPMDEKHPKCAQSPYAASKIAADAMAMAFHAVHQLPVTVVRPFNTYGPRQSQRAVIPALAAQLLWRDSVKVGNLDTRRDFTYVSDTVAGLIAAAECDALIGQEVNLGTGLSFEIREVLNVLRVKCGYQGEITTDEQRVRAAGAEVTELRANNCKMRQATGWQPGVGLVEGLERTVEYVRSHPELYDPERYRI